jgi:nicotinamide-nucleotide amidase
MIAEILATGDEIRSGALVDSNSAHIARRLEEAGIEVVRHTCIGDDRKKLSDIFTEISGRADICLVTGGLGPTEDDLTAETAAAAAGVDLRLDEKALASVEAFFKARSREMSASNRKQAMLPTGAERLDNPIGTAPGFALRIDGCRFYCLPGVPQEMKRMLEEQVLPRCRRLDGAGSGALRTVTISTFGYPESVAGERVAGFTERFPQLKLGLRAKFPEIQVKIYARADDAEKLEVDLAQARQWLLERIGEKTFSTAGQSMQEVVGEALGAAGATVAVAESCTGGLISHWLTNVAGSSAYFRLSAVTYANEAKTAVLGVSARTLEAHGAVHEKTAAEMAEGVRRIAGADYGLSTTGIAGPDGGTPDKPVGTVCIGVASAGGTVARRFFFPFPGRLMNKKIFAMTALDRLRREMIKRQGPGAGRQ